MVERFPSGNRRFNEVNGVTILCKLRRHEVLPIGNLLLPPLYTYNKHAIPRRGISFYLIMFTFFVITPSLL